MKIRHDKHTWTVHLVDSGTMDTQINVNGRLVTFDGEFASQFRKRDGSFSERGFRRLAVEAIESVLDNPPEVPEDWA